MDSSNEGNSMRSYQVADEATTHGMRISKRSTTKPSVIQVETTKDESHLGRGNILGADAVAVDRNSNNGHLTVPASITNSDTYLESSDSFHSALRPAILLAQCFAVFPISGANSPDASYLKFHWKSFKTCYCAVSFLGAVTITVCNILRLAVTGITSTKSTPFVFFGSTCITMILFLRLATQWPKFALAWEKMERDMACRYTRVSKLSLSIRFKLMTIVTMLFALLEHVLSIVSGYSSAMLCAKLRGDTDIISTYFQSQFPQIFSQTSYSLWKGLLVQSINILSTFSWNFMDLFLILISLALAEQFRQLNRRLYGIRGKAKPDWWWTEARTDYNRLAMLSRRVDATISGIVLLSFANNLYFICIQLLNSLKQIRDAAQTVYFCFSFGFLLARTIAVSLFAASVHEESLLPAPVLYSVSGSSYTTEITRFLTQVTTDRISLTGMNFFSITRSLVLTVAGTIVTYELVLVQFNAVQQVESETMNITRACAVK